MTTQTKLKIFPGRGLTGKDIKNRLRNRTLQGQTFGNESYTLDEDMVKFTKMTKVEQVEAARKNAQQVKEIQRKLEEAETKNKQRLAEQEIERKVQEKLREMGKQQSQQNNQA